MISGHIKNVHGAPLANFLVKCTIFTPTTAERIDPLGPEGPYWEVAGVDTPLGSTHTDADGLYTIAVGVGTLPPYHEVDLSSATFFRTASIEVYTADGQALLGQASARADSLATQDYTLDVALPVHPFFDGLPPYRRDLERILEIEHHVTASSGRLEHSAVPGPLPFRLTHVD